MSIQISVIIPTFNRSKIIGRAIRSILSQNVSNIEIIIVDDVSVDNTEEVINTFSDNRIRYIQLVENGGVSKARNRGVQEAKGDLIAFLDSDDEWFVDKLNIQLSVFEKSPECDAVISGFIRHYGRNPEYIAAPQSCNTSDELIAAVFRKNFISAQTLMIRKSVFLSLGGFDESLTHYEDRDFGIRLLEKFNVKMLDIPLAIVYETAGNLTSLSTKKVVALEKFIQKHLYSLQQYRKELAKYYWYLGHSYLLMKNAQKGKKYIRESFFQSINLKSFISLILSLLGCTIYHAVFSMKRHLKK